MPKDHQKKGTWKDLDKQIRAAWNSRPLKNKKKLAIALTGAQISHVQQPPKSLQNVTYFGVFSRMLAPKTR